MRVLFAASEAYPFIKTGGLADVAGSLPLALKESGLDVRVVLPLYSQIDSKFRDKMNFLGYYYVDLGFRHEYAGIFELEYLGLKFYFIDNEHYFKRDTVYGQFDDGERFSFFCKAITILAKYLNFRPDIVHANDWHTGLVPVYFKDFARGDDFYKGIKSLYTIHNLKYQGVFPFEMFGLTGLSMEYFGQNGLRNGDSINFMKGGIAFADHFNTVSKSYCMEIKNSFFGEGLDGHIRANDFKFSGILNGIDYDIWDPAKDSLIAANYSVDQIENKDLCKKALREKVGLEERDCPLVAMVTRLADMKGLDLLVHVFDQIMEEDLQLVILGTGQEKYEYVLKIFEDRYKDKFKLRLHYSDLEAHQIYAGADYFLMPSLFEPCGVSQLIAMRYGSVPIVRETGGLKDTVIPYNEYEKTGTGFSFANINAHEMLYTIKRAVNVYKTADYKMLRENSMKSINNWQSSSEEYINLYKNLTGLEFKKESLKDFLYRLNPDLKFDKLDKLSYENLFEIKENLKEKKSLFLDSSLDRSYKALYKTIFTDRIDSFRTFIVIREILRILIKLRENRASFLLPKVFIFASYGQMDTKIKNYLRSLKDLIDKDFYIKEKLQIGIFENINREEEIEIFRLTDLIELRDSDLELYKKGLIGLCNFLTFEKDRNCSYTFSVDKLRQIDLSGLESQDSYLIEGFLGLLEDFKSSPNMDHVFDSFKSYMDIQEKIEEDFRQIESYYQILLKNLLDFKSSYKEDLWDR